MFFKALYRLLFHPNHPAPYFDAISALVAAILTVLMMYPVIRFIDKRCPVLNGRMRMRS